MNTGHGHVYPREDGVRMRCGGPSICKECAIDAARKAQEPAGNVVPMDRGDPDILKELRKAVRATQRGQLTAYMLVFRDAEGAWDTSMKIDNDLEAIGVIERLRDEVKQEESDGA